MIQSESGRNFTENFVYVSLAPLSHGEPLVPFMILKSDLFKRIASLMTSVTLLGAHPEGRATHPRTKDADYE